MPFEIKQATRQNFKPLIGLYAESGCGKTYSALLLARGLVGPTGRIVMIDTEAGRGSLYADVIPGGYNTVDFTAPFNPSRLSEAIESVEKAGTDVLIIDSASHFWEGIGGVLEWAGENEAAGKKGRHIWKDPKMSHERMLGKLQQTRFPVIVCMRAKHLLVEGKNPDTGKKEMFKDPHATPKQSEDFIYPMTFHAEIRQDHSLRITKISHPSLGKCFPQSGPITIVHGEKLRDWCIEAGIPAVAQTQPQDKPTAAPAAKLPTDPLKAAKSKLWTLCKPFRGDGKTCSAAEQQLITWGIIEPTQTFGDMTLLEVEEAIGKIEVELGQQKENQQ